MLSILAKVIFRHQILGKRAALVSRKLLMVTYAGFHPLQQLRELGLTPAHSSVMPMPTGIAANVGEGRLTLCCL